MWCISDENMKTRKKAGDVWAVSSVGTVRAVCNIDGSFLRYAVSTVVFIRYELMVVFIRYES